jgi:hypothetical protein
MLIGKTTANEGGFSTHDIAVRKTGASRQVFDATLRPDWDVDVSNAVHDYQLTQGRPLGSKSGNPTAKKYLQRLLEGNIAVQFADPMLCDVTMPCLDQCDGPRPDIDPCSELQFMAYRMEIGNSAPAQPQLFPQPNKILAVPIDGFQVVQRVDGPARLAALAPLVSSSVEYWYVAAPDDGMAGGQRRGGRKVDRRQFRMAVCWSPTPTAAQDALAWLMVRTNTRLQSFPTAKKAKVGDATHGSAHGSVVYMVRGNVLVQVASVGKTVAPTEVIARLADKAILSGWSSPPPDEPKGQRPAGRPPSGKSGA